MIRTLEGLARQDSGLFRRIPTEYPVNTHVMTVGESTIPDEEIIEITHLIDEAAVTDQILQTEIDEEKIVQQKSQIRVATKKENGVTVTIEKINITPIEETRETEEAEKITQAIVEAQATKEVERKVA